MQYKTNYTPRPQVGDKRVRKFFAKLPFEFKGNGYWLENVEVCEMYRAKDFGVFDWIVEGVVTNHPAIDLIRKYYPEQGSEGYGYALEYITLVMAKKHNNEK